MGGHRLETSPNEGTLIGDLVQLLAFFLFAEVFSCSPKSFLVRRRSFLFAAGLPTEAFPPLFAAGLFCSPQVS